jgi:hypothetical protein
MAGILVKAVNLVKFVKVPRIIPVQARESSLIRPRSRLGFRLLSAL